MVRENNWVASNNFVTHLRMKNVDATDASRMRMAKVEHRKVSVPSDEVYFKFWL